MPVRPCPCDIVKSSALIWLVLLHAIIALMVECNGDFYQERSLPWSSIELELLTTVKSVKLHDNGYHIAKLQLPSNETSYIIHISKSQGLFHQQHLGLANHEVEHLDCVYSGTIHEHTTNQNLQHIQSGQVSLSSCHHESGFEGLILLPNEQYYIKPLTSSPDFKYARIKRSSTGKTTIFHKAYKINSGFGSKNGDNVDEVLMVPPEELKKAWEKTSANLDLLENEAPETDNLQSENEIGDLQTAFDTDSNCGGSGCDSLPPAMISMGKKSKKATNKNKASAATSSSGSSSSSIRVVEIAVFTDEKLYRTWKNLFPQDTTTKMNQYALTVINNMNSLYKQPSMTEKVSFRLVHLEVQTSNPATLNPSEGHATKYLKSFCSYSAEKNQYGALWDHALLLTGYDLNEKGSNATAGLAWFSTMCINGYSCSVIEGMTFGSTFITAHEIGHSLGMDHDGAGRNAKCDANLYIMSPTTGGGKTDWSTCTVKNMKDFVSKGYSGNPSPKCITKKGSKAGSPIKFSSVRLPGQQFNANEQCRAVCTGCTPYSSAKSPYNDMCHLLFCAKQTSASYVTVQSSHPALEGTTCGKGKVCKVGRCE